MSDQIEVVVNGNRVGSLFKEAREFTFNYQENASNSIDYVSLTMPVRHRGYQHTSLHPIFEMHLPEGYLRSVIEKHFAKITEVDDFGLLKVIASSVRGRLSYVGKNSLRSTLTLDDLKNPASNTLFNDLVSRFALTSAVSGVQPKVLAQVENKATFRMDDYIVKAWGDDYPELAINEYFSMRAVLHAGIPVPEFHISADDALFIMKRFDVDHDGNWLGFEDFCVLQAKSGKQKYQGSYESIAKSIRLFCSPPHLRNSLEQFFKMIVLNNMLRNGDAHLKNFGVLYSSSENVWLAPAYDVISTTFYIEHDMAALTLAGSKRWWNKENLLKFGVMVCNLSSKRARELYAQCADGMLLMKGEIEQRRLIEKNERKIRMFDHLLKLVGDIE